MTSVNIYQFSVHLHPHHKCNPIALFSFIQFVCFFVRCNVLNFLFYYWWWLALCSHSYMMVDGILFFCYCALHIQVHTLMYIVRLQSPKDIFDIVILSSTYVVSRLHKFYMWFLNVNVVMLLVAPFSQMMRWEMVYSGFRISVLTHSKWNAFVVWGYIFLWVWATYINLPFVAKYAQLSKMSWLSLPLVYNKNQ